MIFVKDVMSKDVITVESKETVKKAAEIMAKKNIGCLVITKGKKPYAMVTERDFLRKIIAVKSDYENIKVEDVMHIPLTTVNQDISIIKACELLQQKSFRRLPVTKNGKLIGIVTETDLTRALRSLLTDSMQKFIKDIGK
ncbi:MAG: CBS domain-containing protein [Candidatus Aenigmarchaeota archaeon]|nr:CBS domain-containing protein [Candidatus Aenigmarchaeota archaeon]MCK5062916.1 CBS domain-containing protein [Candidatus Aenigmarchaeota archaeon]MCK5234471.1 CBS domain-containing protein [Candidatus Aenigmarchaeota archaeon]MCK5289524.1 CBS domain-containing protein [Candidatus Aenigmarchaeota archaeon]MCK5372815.1 CBS domain-containing protein [Candidatus Aenigmarchaeota archaeon]